MVQTRDEYAAWLRARFADTATPRHFTDDDPTDVASDT